MLLNYYAIAVAVIVGTVSGIASVSWIRGRVHDSLVAIRAAAIGVVGSLIFSAGALLITGLDGFTLIHVVYVVLTVGVPLAGVIVLIFARERSRAVVALCLSVQVAIPVGIYTTHIEPFWLRTESVTLAVDGVGEGIRVGVLSDLQATAVGPYENEAVDRLIALTPDIVVVPGDLYQFDPDLFGERAPQFSELVQRLVDAVSIVYLVSGNTDTVTGLLRITEGTGARVLDNQIDTLVLKGSVVSIGGITLFGDERVAQRVAQRLSDDELAEVRILLAHKIRRSTGLGPYARRTGLTPAPRASFDELTRAEACRSRRAARVGRNTRLCVYRSGPRTGKCASDSIRRPTIDRNHRPGRK